MIQIKRAILSVSDKTGIVELAQFLARNNVEILSTGGTLQVLQDAGVAARSISEYTGFPEIMDGRVKTLHPKIHGGLLGLRDNPDHVAAMQQNGIEGIDLLVVNLYPFAETIAKEGVSLAEAIENIDIGGPTMLRAGAKNYGHTVVLCDPADYPSLQDDMIAKGGITTERSLQLARRVFNHTAAYDAMIAGYLNELSHDHFPDRLTLTWRKVQDLRYGENPHQGAAYYRPALQLAWEQTEGLQGFRQLHGKELSFNNLLDTAAAIRTACALPRAGIAIIKHLNPCGAAMVKSPDVKLDNVPAGDLQAAFLAARACDAVSAFGGIIASNCAMDADTAESIIENFAEVIVAPAYSAQALAVLESKKNLRIIQLQNPARFLSGIREIRTIPTGALYQDFDSSFLGAGDFKVVTEKKPDDETLQALEFAWRICKNVKSNAIIFTSATATLGIGAGQMSRIDSVEIAVSKSGKAGLDLQGSVAASDAFFPFRDGLDALAKAGARAVVQPGGSVRDQEVIDAANEHGIVMVFTGQRHFLH
ncbi:MAG: bifunctional phosphoribosylaminoimidazolecarboxamide formyltransferase/IMP cyclohydrolase [Leptospiraceae bacterium]|nr:bifunctional phosphoribosylaminoimidazolecarboxamide formyltransferase/IMP cyclohydrolase [Leptospiraceae bacterium]